jgi:hypothetical protein
MTIPCRKMYLSMLHGNWPIPTSRLTYAGAILCQEIRLPKRNQIQLRCFTSCSVVLLCAYLTFLETWNVPAPALSTISALGDAAIVAADY